MFILPLLLLTGCNQYHYKSNHVPNPNAIKYGFHLKEIDENTYDLSFLGSPGSTLEYAIETWDFRAEHLCAPYGYIMLNSNKSTETGTESKTTKPLLDDNAAAGVIGAGGFIGGVILALLTTEFETKNEVSYPKVQGVFKCNVESQSNNSFQPTAGAAG